MSHSFKIWNQSNDQQTMAIRVWDVNELATMAGAYAAPSDDGSYGSLQDFLNHLNTAAAPLEPYRRTVDVFWNTSLGYGGRRFFAGRVLEATRSGNMRDSGGYSAQCYVMVDPEGFASLGPFHMVPISVDIIPGGARDLLVVTV